MICFCSELCRKERKLFSRGVFIDLKSKQMETPCKSIFKHRVKDKDFSNAKGREVRQLHDNMVQSL